VSNTTALDAHVQALWNERESTRRHAAFAFLDAGLSTLIAPEYQPHLNAFFDWLTREHSPHLREDILRHLDSQWTGLEAAQHRDVATRFLDAWVTLTHTSVDALRPWFARRLFDATPQDVLNTFTRRLANVNQEISAAWPMQEHILHHRLRHIFPTWIPAFELDPAQPQRLRQSQRDDDFLRLEVQFSPQGHMLILQWRPTMPPTLSAALRRRVLFHDISVLVERQVQHPITLQASADDTTLILTHTCTHANLILEVTRFNAAFDMIERLTRAELPAASRGSLIRQAFTQLEDRDLTRQILGPQHVSSLLDLGEVLWLAPELNHHNAGFRLGIPTTSWRQPNMTWALLVSRPTELTTNIRTHDLPQYLQRRFDIDARATSIDSWALQDSLSDLSAAIINRPWSLWLLWPPAASDSRVCLGRLHELTRALRMVLTTPPTPTFAQL